MSALVLGLSTPDWLPAFIRVHAGESLDTSHLYAVEGGWWPRCSPEEVAAFEARLFALGCVPIPGSELPPFLDWPVVRRWYLPKEATSLTENIAQRRAA